MDSRFRGNDNSLGNRLSSDYSVEFGGVEEGRVALGVVLGEHFDCRGEFFVEPGDKAIVLNPEFFDVAQNQFRRKNNLICVEG